MSSGLRAMTEAAREKSLPFSVTLHCGQMIVNGRIASPDTFHEVTRNTYGLQLSRVIDQELGRKASNEERERAFRDAWEAVGDAFAKAREADWDSDIDEVTLVEATIL